MLNSNCTKVAGGCSAGSAQEQWLRANLAAHTSQCTVAYWHHPRFSSGSHHGRRTVSSAFWADLYQNGADLVMVGHEHNYERFAPQSPTGEADPNFGIRQFVVGTGGADHYGFSKKPAANSEVRSTGTSGVLELTLSPGSYTWEFVPVAGKTFTDSGTTACHGPPGLSAPVPVG